MAAMNTHSNSLRQQLDTLMATPEYQAALAAVATPAGPSIAEQQLLDRVFDTEQRLNTAAVLTQPMVFPAVPQPGAQATTTALANTTAPTADTSEDSIPPAKYKLFGYEREFKRAKDGQVNQSAKSQHNMLCVVAEPFLGGVKRALEDTGDDETAADLKRKIVPLLTTGKQLCTRYAKYLTIAAEEGFQVAAHYDKLIGQTGLSAEEVKAVATARSMAQAQAQAQASDRKHLARDLPPIMRSNIAPYAHGLNLNHTQQIVPMQYPTHGNSVSSAPLGSQAGHKAAPSSMGNSHAADKANTACFNCGLTGHWARECTVRVGSVMHRG